MRTWRAAWPSGRPAAARQRHPVSAEAGEQFEDLYEEYRRTIVEDQRRASGAPEQHVPSGHRPPPLPAAQPPTGPPPVTRVTAPPEAAAGPLPAVWQAPAIPRPEDLLTPAEQAALAALRARDKPPTPDPAAARS